MANPKKKPTQRKMTASDRKQLDALVVQFHAGLFGYIRTQVRNATDAEDLLDDVWLDVCKMVQARALDFPRAGGLVYRMAHFKCIDLLRRRRRSRVRPNDGATDWDGACPGPAAGEVTARDEDARRVRAALDRLPRQERSVVYLRYFQDMTLQEIAAVEGVSGPPQVSRILARAETRLEQSLG